MDHTLETAPVVKDTRAVRTMDIFTPEGTIHCEYHATTVSLAEAQATFEKYRSDGYVALSEGIQLKDFDPEADEISMLLPLAGG